MKKLIVLPVVLILIAGLCFAQNDENTAPERPAIERFDLEVHVGFPIHWTNAEHNQDFYYFTLPDPDYKAEDKTVTANTAIGFSTVFNFGKKVGFTIDADFFYGAKLAGFANPTSDSISMFGANALIGPVFYLYNGIFLRIPLAVGAHLYYFSDDFWVPHLAGFDKDKPPSAPPPDTSGYWMNRRDFQMGPGISLGVQFHFSNSIYIFSRTNVSLDVFRWHKITYVADYDDGNGDQKKQQSKSEMEFAISWSVKPTLGIGIKF